MLLTLFSLNTLPIWWGGKLRVGRDHISSFFRRCRDGSTQSSKENHDKQTGTITSYSGSILYGITCPMTA